MATPAPALKPSMKYFPSASVVVETGEPNVRMLTFALGTGPVDPNTVPRTTPPRTVALNVVRNTPWMRTSIGVVPAEIPNTRTTPADSPAGIESDGATPAIAGVRLSKASVSPPAGAGADSVTGTSTWSPAMTSADDTVTSDTLRTVRTSVAGSLVLPKMSTARPVMATVEPGTAPAGTATTNEALALPTAGENDFAFENEKAPVADTEMRDTPTSSSALATIVRSLPGHGLETPVRGRERQRGRIPVGDRQDERRRRSRVARRVGRRRRQRDRLPGLRARRHVDPERDGDIVQRRADGARLAGGRRSGRA